MTAVVFEPLAKEQPPAWRAVSGGAPVSLCFWVCLCLGRNHGRAAVEGRTVEEETNGMLFTLSLTTWMRLNGLISIGYKE